MTKALVVLALVACNKTSADALPAASSAATSASAAPVNNATITRDGKDAPKSHVMIQKTANGALQIYVGDGSGCAEFKLHLFNGGKFFLVDLGTAANGGVYPVTNVWHGPPDNADPGSTVTVRGDVATASKVEVDFAMTSKEAKIEAKGTLTADVCK